jgi:hypothetical protein
MPCAGSRLTAGDASRQGSAVTGTPVQAVGPQRANSGWRQDNVPLLPGLPFLDRASYSRMSLANCSPSAVRVIVPPSRISCGSRQRARPLSPFPVRMEDHCGSGLHNAARCREQPGGPPPSIAGCHGEGEGEGDQPGRVIRR